MATPSHTRTPSVAAALVAALLLAALVSGLLWDVAHFSGKYIYLHPRPVGDESVVLADRIKRNRVLSYLIGLAVREAAGDALVERVIAPEDLSALSSAEPDDSQGRPNPALGEPLIAPLVRDRLETASYDSILPAETIARFEAEDRLVEFPRGVFAVTTDSGSAETIVLYSDAAKQRMYAVPEELAPR